MSDMDRELPFRAFGLMDLDARLRVLASLSRLRYPSIEDRFFEAVHREILRQRTAAPETPAVAP